MEEPLSTDPYKGVRDFYPSEWAKLDAIFARVRTLLKLWGYEEYNASPLERAELYEAKTSEEIVNDQTYTFTDRGERKVTLRPEMTPTLARMIAAKRRELPYPLRWFSIPNVFRYERPQKGRLREHYQLNVDLVGAASTEADIELISVASAIPRAFGARDEDFVIRINSRALLTAACVAVGLSEEARRSYLRLLDKKAKMTPEEFSIALQSITSEDPLSLIEDPSAYPEVATEKTKLLRTIDAIKERGATNAVFDATLTRGFDYYTGIVFEIFDTNPENPRSLFGGGRYDELVTLFGGDPIPAIGFGMGDVTFADFLETHGLAIDTSGSAPALYIGTPTPEDIPVAQEVAASLRASGVRTFVNLSDKGLGDQIKDALKRSIPYFMAYGANEATSGSIRLKTLAKNEEETLSIASVASKIKAAE